HEPKHLELPCGKWLIRYRELGLRTLFERISFPWIVVGNSSRNESGSSKRSRLCLDTGECIRRQLFCKRLVQPSPLRLQSGLQGHTNLLTQSIGAERQQRGLPKFSRSRIEQCQGLDRVGNMPALHDRRIEHQAGLQCISGTLELAHRHEHLAGVSI